jgi:FtsP/CotA-like multicopper oxidase with cupredoxin domain
VDGCRRQRLGRDAAVSLYRGYTDANFTHRIHRGKGQRYLGLLGPVIHAVVGDKVKIVFRNNCNFPDSIHMHGLKYDKASEGAPYNDGTHGAKKLDDAVKPGHTYTYHYVVPGRPVRPRATSPRSCGCITPTPTRSVTPTRA